MEMEKGDIIFYANKRKLMDKLIPGNFKHCIFCLGKFEDLVNVIIKRKIKLNEFQLYNIQNLFFYEGFIVMNSSTINGIKEWILQPSTYLEKCEVFISRYVKKDETFCDDLIAYVLSRIGNKYKVVFNSKKYEEGHCHDIVFYFLEKYYKEKKKPINYSGLNIILSLNNIDENFQIFKWKK